MSAKSASDSRFPGQLATRLSRIFIPLLALTALLGLAGAPPWAFAILFGAVAVAWFLINREILARTKPLERANQSLSADVAARETALVASAGEKDALVREVHHRVRNNLQVIASLVNLQQRSVAEPSAQAALSDMRDRVAALALIHRTLYQGADLQHVEVRDFLAGLIDEQITDSNGPDGRLRAELSADSLLIDSDRLAPLALFAVEAISNARKRALRSSPGALKIAFHVRGAEAELVVADDGGDETLDLSPHGAGRVLMSGFARQLKGRMVLGVNETGGVTACLVFPTLLCASPTDVEAGNGT